MVMVVGLVLNNNNSNTESVSGFILLYPQVTLLLQLLYPLFD